MQSTYFPNRFGSKSSTEGKQDFSIHRGMCASHYVNNAVFRQAQAIMRICEFKSQSATYVNAINIPQLQLYSFLSIADTGRLLDPSHLDKEAGGKLSVLPSDNDKMMTGLWPRLHGLQESCWQAKGIKGKKREENGEVWSTTAIYYLSTYQQVWCKQWPAELNSLHFSKMDFFLFFFWIVLWDCVFLQSKPISALTMFNKCLIGWVHESQSNLAFPSLSVYWTVSVYVNESWLAALPPAWSQRMPFIRMKKEAV